MINKNMIALARDLRSINQVELAEKIGMSRANIGKIENGDIGVKDETIELIAQATNLPFSFFEQENEIIPEHLIYRKRDNVSQTLMLPLNAKINILKFGIQKLINELGTPNIKLPTYQVSTTDTPQEIAKKLRREWGLYNPVTNKIIELLENKGIVVATFDFGTERVDSRCVLTDTKHPIIIYNSTLLGDKQRYSLVYQLGHLVMHTAYKLSHDRDIAHEANLFAAEFLMSEDAISHDLSNTITIPYLAELKQKWKVSMIALLYRADDLGYLTPNQKKYILQQFNELQIRRREPKELDLPIEKPTLLKDWINEVMGKKNLDINGIAKLLNLNAGDFIELYK